MHTSSTDLFQRLWQELALPPGATRPPLSEQEVECLMRDRVSLLDGPCVRGRPRSSAAVDRRADFLPSNPQRQPTSIAGRTDRVVYAGGVVILTSHRIIWHSREGGQGQGQGRAFQAHLSVVASARKSRNPFKPSKCVACLT